MTSKAYVPPDGRMLTPYICCRETSKAIEWYVDVFGARLTEEPYVGADGRIGHAEIDIDGAAIMLSDGYPEVGVGEPASHQLPTYSLYLHLPDVDTTMATAARAGATVQHEVEDAAHGARVGTILDPFGVRWMLATHTRTVGEDELGAARRDFAADGE